MVGRLWTIVLGCFLSAAVWLVDSEATQDGGPGPPQLRSHQTRLSDPLVSLQPLNPIVSTQVRDTRHHNNIDDNIRNEQSAVDLSGTLDGYTNFENHPNDFGTGHFGSGDGGGGPESSIFVDATETGSYVDTDRTGSSGSSHTQVGSDGSSIAGDGNFGSRLGSFSHDGTGSGYSHETFSQNTPDGMEDFGNAHSTMTQVAADETGSTGRVDSTSLPSSDAFGVENNDDFHGHFSQSGTGDKVNSDSGDGMLTQGGSGGFSTFRGSGLKSFRDGDRVEIGSSDNGNRTFGSGGNSEAKHFSSNETLNRNVTGEIQNFDDAHWTSNRYSASLKRHPGNSHRTLSHRGSWNIDNSHNSDSHGGSSRADSTDNSHENSDGSSSEADSSESSRESDSHENKDDSDPFEPSLMTFRHSGAVRIQSHGPENHHDSGHKQITDPHHNGVTTYTTTPSPPHGAPDNDDSTHTPNPHSNNGNGKDNTDTTIPTPATTLPVKVPGHFCKVCDGPLCPFVQHDMWCDNSFCMTTIEQNPSGTSKIIKGCVTLDVCITKWLVASAHGKCMENHGWGSDMANANSECHFCCVGDFCNDHVYPELNTLYGADSLVST